MTTPRLPGVVGPCRPKFGDCSSPARFQLRHVLRALFGAFILTLALPFTTPAAIKTGVTVLVHGFVSFENLSDVTPFDYWGGGSNLRKLLERFGSGKVWEYDPGSGDYVDITSRIPGRDITWTNSDLGQHILLFDWTDGSDEEESGQAEAAADALFASLMNFRFTGSQRIISISPYAAVRPLHFIGHSRGTVVVSETVQRLGRYNIRVNYVTYLDIHDFGQPDIRRDEFFHDPAVQVWENIDYADAAYQQNPANMCGVNPAGRRLAGIPMGVLQRDLTGFTRLGPLEPYQCTDHGRPHAWIKEYYWGTVATNGGSANRPAIWYEAGNGNGTGSGFGFDLWWQRGGFDQGPDPSLTRVRCVVASDAVPYVWNPPEENHASDRNDVPPLLFNGDFELPNLDGGIGETEVNSLAGWRYLGGGGNASVGSSDGNFYLEAKLDLTGNSVLLAHHNRFFLPLEARDLLFAINVPITPLTVFDEYLRVRVGSEVLGDFSVNNKTDGFQPHRVDLGNFPGLLGRINTLTFELFTAPLEEMKLQIDNINIVTEPTAWVHSLSFDASNWRLFWRSWPSATITLEACSDLVSWAPIQSGSTAGNAGSFTIPQTAGRQRFFRFKAVPER